jgi:ornithine cyclodeaminase/alanine dehydrogenase-like protein (mu-crystallin family)
VTLILSESDVRQVLTFSDTVKVLEPAHLAFSKGEAVQPTRLQLPVEKYNGRLLIMPGFIPSSGSLAVKIVGGFHDNRELGLPSAFGIVILHDAQTGEIIAVMDGAHLTGVRTAATAVLATRYMSRPRPKKLTILGGGYIGRMCARAFSEELQLNQIRVHSRTKATATGFKEELEDELDAAIEVFEDPESACRGADVLVTATASKNPVLHYDWLEPGAHINAMGSSLPDSREVDTKIIQHARLIVESRQATLAEAGDVLVPLHNGEVSSEVIFAEIGEVIAGHKPGRESDQEITLFKSVGIAIQDAATARLVYEKAKAIGIGKEVAIFDLPE